MNSNPAWEVQAERIRMPARTNSKHPNHIATESSKVAAEIEPILDFHLNGRASAKVLPEVVTDLTDALTTLLMQHKNDQAYTSYRLGFADAKAGKEMTDEAAYEQLPENHGARE
jgi:hypothetical protein